MNVQTHQKLLTVPVADLHLSPINPRQTVSEDYIESLAASIAEIGLIQPLGVYQTDAGYEVVAGGCRLRALKTLLEGQPNLEAPITITTDEDTAKLWSVAENEVRRQLRPAALARAARSLLVRGEDAERISRILGTTLALARQYIALSNLTDAALEALDEEEISFDQAKVIAQVPKGEEAEAALAMAKDGTQPWTMRRHYFGSVRESDEWVKFVGLDAIKEAGGILQEDLFEGGTTIRGDFDLAQMVEDKVQARIKELEDEGWGWVKYHGQGVSSWDIEKIGQKVTKKKASKHRELVGVSLFFGYSRDFNQVYLVMPKDAEAAFEAGLISEDERDALKIDAQKPEKDDKPAPDFSAKLLSDLKQTRLLTIMAELRSKPELVLDLLAYQISDATSHWDKALSISCEENNTMPDKADGLTIPEDTLERSGYGSETMEFDAFRELGKKHRNTVLAEVLTRSLFVPSKMEKLEQIGDLADAPMRRYWTPTAENLFNRVNVGVLTKIYCEVLDLDADDERLKTFLALKKKADKVGHIEKLFAGPELDEALKVTPEQRQRIDAWTPDLDQ
jgi:ParB family transcriptional regulator, chromosome partitioning protein